MIRRRAFLALMSARPILPATGKGQEAEGDRQRFLDPTTEFEVVRLTSTEYESILPSNTGRAVSKRADFLVCGSDRGQGMQAYRIDIKTGKTRQLTELSALEPETMTLAGNDRWLYAIDGRRLLQINLGSLRERQIAELTESARKLSVSEDGFNAAYAEKVDGKTRLRFLPTGKPVPQTVAEFDGTLTEVGVRPKRAGLFYVRDGSLWLASFDGRENRELKTPPGQVLEAQWSPDGRTVLYLHKPEGEGKLNEIREIVPDTNTDVLLAKTSQFVRFAPNGDASVFLGASGSKAQPTLLLLLRTVRRELTICEHKCSDARISNPTFSSNSQRIFFQTDRHGKMVIYSMAVDRLVDPTDEDPK
jgi:oligogalacturonide lyase